MSDAPWDIIDPPIRRSADPAMLSSDLALTRAAMKAHADAGDREGLRSYLWNTWKIEPQSVGGLDHFFTDFDAAWRRMEGLFGLLLKERREQGIGGDYPLQDPKTQEKQEELLDLEIHNAEATGRRQEELLDLEIRNAKHEPPAGNPPQDAERPRRRRTFWNWFFRNQQPIDGSYIPPDQQSIDNNHTPPDQQPIDNNHTPPENNTRQSTSSPPPRRQRNRERSHGPDEEQGVSTFKALVFSLGLLLLFYGIGFHDTAVLFIAVPLLAAHYFSSAFRRDFATVLGIGFFATFVAHALLFRGNYSFGNWTVALALTPYVAVMVYVFFFDPDRRERLTTNLTFTIISLGLYALPSAAQMLTGESSTVSTIAIAGVTLLPLWPLYLLHVLGERNPDGYAAKTLVWWKTVLAIVVFVSLIYGLYLAADIGPQFQLPGVDARAGLTDAFDKFIEMLKNIWSRITKGVSQAYNPGAYYRGQVEENKRKPLGVKIVDLRPLDVNVPNGSEVVVYGNVEAVSFLGEQITVIPACLIDRRGAPSALVDPAEMDIVFGTAGTFQCTFPPMPNTGTYSVKGSATFPFQTWAYITYTFVDRERATNIARQGQDIKQVLGITQEPIATYTNGPVELGMGGTPQPILVAPDDDPILPRGTRIGITLDPGWVSGTLNHVRRLELKVPSIFALEDCDRQVTSSGPDQFEPEYTSYVFENTALDVVTTYTSVTCQLVATDAEAARALVSTDTAVLSFIGVAEYTYTVEARTSVRVR